MVYLSCFSMVLSRFSTSPSRFLFVFISLFMNYFFGFLFHHTSLFPLIPFLTLACIEDYFTGEIPDIVSIAILVTSIVSKQIHVFYFVIIIIVFGFCACRNYLGFGDTKLFASYSLLIGRRIYLVLFCASLFALVYSLCAHKKTGQVIRFAPFIVIGCYVEVLFCTL